MWKICNVNGELIRTRLFLGPSNRRDKEPKALKQAIHKQYHELPEPQLVDADDKKGSYNVAPTETAPVLRIGSDKAILAYMSWGYVPFWTKEHTKERRYKTFNARKESIVHGNRLWSPAVKHHRCVVPLDGYYEWLHKGKRKIPHYIKRKDSKLMFFAGLWSHAHIEDTGEDIATFTIITEPAPKRFKWLNARLPLILEPGTPSWDRWLSGDELGDDLIGALDVHEHDELEWYEVTSEVGKTSNEGSHLNRPVKGIEQSFKRTDGSSKVAETENDDKKGVKTEADNKGSRKHNNVKQEVGGEDGTNPQQEEANDEKDVSIASRAHKRREPDTTPTKKAKH